MTPQTAMTCDDVCPENSGDHASPSVRRHRTIPTYNGAAVSCGDSGSGSKGACIAKWAFQPEFEGSFGIADQVKAILRRKNAAVADILSL